MSLLVTSLLSFVFVVWVYVLSISCLFGCENYSHDIFRVKGFFPAKTRFIYHCNGVILHCHNR